jgi:hypothetical protein
VHVQGVGFWCRREDSNLHGAINPTRSLVWRFCRFRSELKHLNDTPVTWVHLHATAPEYSLRAKVPSGCPYGDGSEHGPPVFEALTRQASNLVAHSPGLTLDGSCPECPDLSHLSFFA